MSGYENGHWSDTTLAEVAWNVRMRVKPQERPDLPFIGMDNVEAHTMRLLGTVPASTMKSSAVHFRPDDVLYGRLRPYLNKVLTVGFEGLASAEFIPLTMPEGVNPQFVQYRLNSAKFVAFTSTIDTGDRPRVDYGQIGEFELRLPPTGEQSRIVEAIESYLTRLDDAVATLERVQRNLKRYRASVLKAAVEGRLVPTDAELARAEGRDYEPASVLLERILKERRCRWIEEAAEKGRAKAEEKAKKAGQAWSVENNAAALENGRAKAAKQYKEPAAPDTKRIPGLPDTWCWAKLDQLLLFIEGGNSATAQNERTERKVLRSSAVRQGWIDFDDFRYLATEAPKKTAPYLEPGDLVFTRLSGSLEYVGNCAEVPQLTGRKFEFPDRIFRGRVAPSLTARYVQHCFAVRKLRRHLEDAAKSAAGHQRIGLDDLRKYQIPLPPMAEQGRISEHVAKVRSVADSTEGGVEVQIRRLSRLRQSILKWAFEGKLVDQDTADEPAFLLLERIKAERAVMEASKKNNRKSRRKRKAK